MHTVRAATTEDAQAIHELSKALGYEEPALEQTYQRLQHLINSETDYVWVAVADGQLLGWVHAFVAHRLASASFVEIGGLVVSDRARRQGVGRTLVRKVQQVATTRNVPVRVRCNSQRVESHAFYQEIGFDSQKEQRVFDA